MKSKNCITNIGIQQEITKKIALISNLKIDDNSINSIFINSELEMNNLKITISNLVPNNFEFNFIKIDDSEYENIKLIKLEYSEDFIKSERSKLPSSVAEHINENNEVIDINDDDNLSQQDNEKSLQKIQEYLNKKIIENNLIFDELTHKYFINNIEFQSVTEYISKFKNIFNAEEISNRKANNDKIKQQELLLKWDLEGKKAINFGNHIHYELDKFISNLLNKNPKEIKLIELDDLDKKKKENLVNKTIYIIKYYLKNDWQILSNEQFLFDKKYLLAGQADLILYKNINNRINFLIIDYKTTKKENFSIKKYTQKMLPPFQYLYDYSYHNYILQLGVYRMLLNNMLKDLNIKNLNINSTILALNLDNTIINIDNNLINKITEDLFNELEQKNENNFDDFNDNDFDSIQQGEESEPDNEYSDNDNDFDSIQQGEDDYLNEMKKNEEHYFEALSQNNFDYIQYDNQKDLENTDDDKNNKLFLKYIDEIKFNITNLLYNYIGHINNIQYNNAAHKIFKENSDSTFYFINKLNNLLKYSSLKLDNIYFFKELTNVFTNIKNTDLLLYDNSEKFLLNTIEKILNFNESFYDKLNKILENTKLISEENKEYENKIDINYQIDLLNKLDKLLIDFKKKLETSSINNIEKNLINLYNETDNEEIKDIIEKEYEYFFEKKLDPYKIEFEPNDKSDFFSKYNKGNKSRNFTDKFSTQLLGTDSIDKLIASIGFKLFISKFVKEIRELNNILNNITNISKQDQHLFYQKNKEGLFTGHFVSLFSEDFNNLDKSNEKKVRKINISNINEQIYIDSLKTYSFKDVPYIVDLLIKEQKNKLKTFNNQANFLLLSYLNRINFKIENFDKNYYQNNLSKIKNENFYNDYMNNIGNFVNEQNPYIETNNTKYNVYFPYNYEEYKNDDIIKIFKNEKLKDNFIKLYRIIKSIEIQLNKERFELPLIKNKLNFSNIYNSILKMPNNYDNSVIQKNLLDKEFLMKQDNTLVDIYTTLFIKQLNENFGIKIFKVDLSNFYGINFLKDYPIDATKLKKRKDIHDYFRVYFLNKDLKNNVLKLNIFDSISNLAHYIIYNNANNNFNRDVKSLGYLAYSFDNGRLFSTNQFVNYLIDSNINFPLFKVETNKNLIKILKEYIKELPKEEVNLINQIQKFISDNEKVFTLNTITDFLLNGFRNIVLSYNILSAYRNVQDAINRLNKIQFYYSKLYDFSNIYNAHVILYRRIYYKKYKDKLNYLANLFQIYYEIKSIPSLKNPEVNSIHGIQIVSDKAAKLLILVTLLDNYKFIGKDGTEKNIFNIINNNGRIIDDNFKTDENINFIEKGEGKKFSNFLINYLKIKEDSLGSYNNFLKIKNTMPKNEIESVVTPYLNMFLRWLFTHSNLELTNYGVGLSATTKVVNLIPEISNIIIKIIDPKSIISGGYIKDIGKAVNSFLNLFLANKISGTNIDKILKENKDIDLSKSRLNKAYIKDTFIYSFTYFTESFGLYIKMLFNINLALTEGFKNSNFNNLNKLLKDKDVFIKTNDLFANNISLKNNWQSAALNNGRKTATAFKYTLIILCLLELIKKYKDDDDMYDILKLLINNLSNTAEKLVNAFDIDISSYFSRFLDYFKKEDSSFIKLLEEPSNLLETREKGINAGSPNYYDFSRIFGVDISKSEPTIRDLNTENIKLYLNFFDDNHRYDNSYDLNIFLDKKWKNIQKEYENKTNSTISIEDLKKDFKGIPTNIIDLKFQIYINDGYSPDEAYKLATDYDNKLHKIYLSNNYKNLTFLEYIARENTAKQYPIFDDKYLNLYNKNLSILKDKYPQFIDKKLIEIKQDEYEKLQLKKLNKKLTEKKSIDNFLNRKK